jgi:inosine-uridine nucleoside N-ribohydrolase
MLMRKILLMESLYLLLLCLPGSPTFAGLALAGEEQQALPKRVWVDADAACGLPGRVDPDDCFALVYLLSRPDLEIVGVSTVFGNAPLDDTDRVTREIVGGAVPVYRGAAGPGALSSTPAGEALAQALEDGPLTLLALGPLTNLRDVFALRPTLISKVEGLVAVMGKCEGHLFHPSEGSAGAAFFGHGPIFTDFNFVQNLDAARAVMALSLSVTLIPYEAARQVTLTSDDVRALAQRGGIAGEVASRSGEWLSFWQETVGVDGFYPFDLVAAAYVDDPKSFGCRRTGIRIGSDRRAYGPLPGPQALMVGGLAGTRGGVLGEVLGEVLYCDQVVAGLAGELVQTLLTVERAE